MFRKIAQTFVFTFLVCFLLSNVGNPVSAQTQGNDQPTLSQESQLQDESSSSAQNTNVEDSELELSESASPAASHEEKIKTIRQRYLEEIDAYRRAEQNFTVAKTQYFNIQTLKSLEDAVIATRQVMFERSRVLTTYSEFLYETLQNMGGVNIEFKQTQIKALEELITDLRRHTQTVEMAQTRDDVNKLRDDFALLTPQIDDTLYRSMTLISLGKIQTVYDKGRIVQSDLDEHLNSTSVSAIKKAERERAFAETDRNLTNLKVSLDEVNSYYAEQDKLVSRQFYNRALDDLKPIYAQLSQILSYLAELLRV